jgi:hypothetical protein
MVYLSITEIDAKTKIICTAEPMRTGPAYPQIKNFNFMWCNQSTWPISTTPEGAYTVAPLFFGTCDDDADLSVEGVISIYTQEEFFKLKTMEYQARKPFPSWVGNEETMVWIPPVPYPEGADPHAYRWDEETTSWKEVEQ